MKILHIECIRAEGLDEFHTPSEIRYSAVVSIQGEDSAKETTICPGQGCLNPKWDVSMNFPVEKDQINLIVLLPFKVEYTQKIVVDSYASVPMNLSGNQEVSKTVEFPVAKTSGELKGILYVTYHFTESDNIGSLSPPKDGNCRLVLKEDLSATMISGSDMWKVDPYQGLCRYATSNGLGLALKHSDGTGSGKGDGFEPGQGYGPRLLKIIGPELVLGYENDPGSVHRHGQYPGQGYGPVSGQGDVSGPGQGNEAWYGYGPGYGGPPPPQHQGYVYLPQQPGNYPAMQEGPRRSRFGIRMGLRLLAAHLGALLCGNAISDESGFGDGGDF